MSENLKNLWNGHIDKIKAIVIIATLFFTNKTVDYWVRSKVARDSARQQWELTKEQEIFIDSVKSTVKDVKTADAINMGMHAYAPLFQLQKKVNCGRSFIFYLRDYRSIIDPAYKLKGEMESEVTADDVQPIISEWKDIDLAKGIRSFLARVQEKYLTANSALIIDTVRNDPDLMGPVTSRYIKAYGTRALIAIYIGENTKVGEEGHYFLVCSFYQRPLDQDRDSYQIQMERVATQYRRIFNLSIPKL